MVFTDGSTIPLKGFKNSPFNALKANVEGFAEPPIGFLNKKPNR
jgi:hypothetical protein